MTFDPETDLEIARLIKASPETLQRCWEDSGLLKTGFVPPPVEATEVKNDPRLAARLLGWGPARISPLSRSRVHDR